MLTMEYHRACRARDTTYRISPHTPRLRLVSFLLFSALSFMDFTDFRRLAMCRGCSVFVCFLGIVVSIISYVYGRSLISRIMIFVLRKLRVGKLGKVEAKY